MWNLAIPVLCVLAHVYLAVLFLPGLWREIGRRGFRWSDGVSLFGAPLLIVVLVGRWLAANLGHAPDWLVLVAFLTIDALVVAMLLAAIGLRRRARRSP